MHHAITHCGPSPVLHQFSPVAHRSPGNQIKYRRTLLKNFPSPPSKAFSVLVMTSPHFCPLFIIQPALGHLSFGDEKMEKIPRTTQAAVVDFYNDSLECGEWSALLVAVCPIHSLWSTTRGEFMSLWTCCVLASSSLEVPFHHCYSVTTCVQ